MSLSKKIFSPFVIYVYGILGREELVILANLSQLMEEKMYEPVFLVWGWVNCLIAIAVMISHSKNINGARIPSPLLNRYPEWDPSLGLRLAH